MVSITIRLARRCAPLDRLFELRQARYGLCEMAPNNPSPIEIWNRAERRLETEQVYGEAQACIREGGPRYVLGSACAVPRFAPVENMHAFARAASEVEL